MPSHANAINKLPRTPNLQISQFKINSIKYQIAPYQKSNSNQKGEMANVNLMYTGGGGQLRGDPATLQGAGFNRTATVGAGGSFGGAGGLSPVRPGSNLGQLGYGGGGYIEGVPAGQRVISTGQPVLLSPQNANTTSQAYYQSSSPQPYLVPGSQLARTTYQSMTPSIMPSMGPSIYKSALRETSTPIQVFTATGPPLPPVQTSIIRPLESQVRTVNYVGAGAAGGTGAVAERREEKVQASQPPPQIIQQPPIQGPTIYESVVKERYDPEFQSRKTMYQGRGYTDTKKGTPCCLALLGLLALAGLLTGLFFLIRAINAGAGGSAQTRAPVNYKQNATTTNSSSNTSVIVTPGTGGAANGTLSPIVIDVNTNPTVNGSNGSSSATAGTTGTTTVVTVPTTSTTTTTTTTGTTTGGTTTTTGGTTGTTTGTTTTGGTTTGTTTGGATTIGGNTGTSTTTGGSTTGTTGTTGTTSGTSTSTTPSPTNNSTPISTTPTQIPPTASTLTPQQQASDPNIQTIDSYLRTQDAIRLGKNPTLQTVATGMVNGVKNYYFSYNNGAGKNYLYGLVMGVDGVPSVKTVSVTADTTGTTGATTAGTTTGTTTGTGTTSGTTAGTTTTTPSTTTTTTTTTVARHRLALDNPRKSHQLRAQHMY